MIWMPLALPDPPTSLRGPARAFYDELREMLAAVAPTQVDDSKSSVRFDDIGVELELAHAERSDWCIWATVGDRDAIAGTNWAHEHFFPSQGTPDDGAWTTQIVDFIAEILRGEIEIEKTFRGDTLLSVRHFNRDDDGERNLLGLTGFLFPGRLLVWKRKRTETEHASFL
jgi:hypothetical protein